MFDRFKEPSTYAGVAAIVAGVGQVVDFNEAPAIAEGLNHVTAAVTGGGGGWAASGRPSAPSR